MSTDEPRRRPPPVPQSILDRRHQRPRGILEGERQLNAVVERAAVNSLLDLAAHLQQRLCEAVGLLDAGKVSDARALLDTQVRALDALDTTPLEQR